MAFLYQRSLGWVMIILSVFASPTPQDSELNAAASVIEPAARMFARLATSGMHQQSSARPHDSLFAL
jgi:hypothetical protein